MQDAGVKRKPEDAELNEQLNECRKVIFWSVFGSENLHLLVQDKVQGCDCRYCASLELPWCLPLECKRMDLLRSACTHSGLRFEVLELKHDTDEAGKKIECTPRKELNSSVVNVDADIVWCCKKYTDTPEDLHSSDLYRRFFFGTPFNDLESNGDELSKKLVRLFHRMRSMGDRGLEKLPAVLRDFYLSGKKKKKA